MNNYTFEQFVGILDNWRNKWFGQLIISYTINTSIPLENELLHSPLLLMIINHMPDCLSNPPRLSSCPLSHIVPLLIWQCLACPDMQRATHNNGTMVTLGITQHEVTRMHIYKIKPIGYYIVKRCKDGLLQWGEEWIS